MKLTQAEFLEHQDNHAGFCTTCDEVTAEDIEPDAEGIECPECGQETVKGIEQALIYEDIEITDEEGDSDDIGIISLSDEDEDDDYE